MQGFGTRWGGERAWEWPPMHSQLVQVANLPSSCTETRPLTLKGPRLTYRNTSQKRSGEVTFILATILGWGDMVDRGHPSLATHSWVLWPQRPAHPTGHLKLRPGEGRPHPPGRAPFGRSPSN